MENKLINVAVLRPNHLAEHIRQRNQILKKDITIIAPWLRACPVNVLLVTDGNLNFGRDDFGLSAFIDCLQNDNRTYVAFNITLAHLRTSAADSPYGVTEEQMGSAIPNIVRRITDFRFDEPTHFTTDMYDQIWLFGIETNYHWPTAGYSYRTSNPTAYPADRLSDAELNLIGQFMDAGKGVFATGDHGALGRALCGSIPRVKSMRLWDSTPGEDEVSMAGARRNDTNQVGHDPGTQFSDQSDDVPQIIEPKFYHQRVGSFLDALYPHPLLCSKFGLIDVLPDHPHEGECRVPTTEAELAEYPASGGTTLLPEVIAHSRVLSGNTGRLHSRSKSLTQAQTFGAISAYDGHRTNVGRIVTDATWHHFVNVNLIGLVEDGPFDDLDASNSPTKHDGFMSSAQGQAVLAKIKEYFINIGVWICPPGLIHCFNSKFLWKLIYSDRIMESALVDPNVEFTQIRPSLFYSIGTHAKDVLGRSASKCQTLLFLIDLIKVHIPELIPRFDPWFPFPKPIPEPEPPLPWFDPTPIINIMLGTVLVALRQEFPYSPTEFNEDFDKRADTISYKAARAGLEMGLKHYAEELKSYEALLQESFRSLENKRADNNAK